MREQRALARDQVADDLAGPAFFLASADSDFMTCQTDPRGRRQEHVVTVMTDDPVHAPPRGDVL